MIEAPVLLRALDRCVSAQLTFAAFRRPGAHVEIWAQRDPSIERLEGDLLWEANQVFVVAPFDLDMEHVPLIRSDVELEFGPIDPDIEDLFHCVGAGPRTLNTLTRTVEQDFLRSVGAARTAIASGPLEKVVLSRVETAPFAPGDLAALFMAAATDQPHAMITLVHTPDHGFWFGTSPERLVVEEEDHVRMDALAGTMPSATAPRDASQWGAKERHEQGAVKRAILAACQDMGLATAVSGTEVITTGELAHLRTVIETDLQDRTLSDLVLALHPTPAVCGTPRDTARSFIHAHETHDRGLYTGFWGPWCPDGRTELFVNIRCMHLQNGQAVVFAGAGITAGSDPEGEWKETGAKADVLLKTIARLPR